MKNGPGLTAHRSENPFSEADDDTDHEQAGGQDDPGPDERDHRGQNCIHLSPPFIFGTRARRMPEPQQ